MFFLAPVWLIALLPWTAAAIWLLRGRPARRTVPFVSLWRGPFTGSPSSKARRIPPLPLVLLLISGLLAILAAARCAVHLPRRSGPLITVIIDTGRSTPSPEVLAAAIKEVQTALLDAFGQGPVDFVSLPSGALTRGDRSAPTSFTIKSISALDTRSALQRAVAEALDRNDAPVVVLSNQAVESKSPRVITVPISESISNVGFISIAARETPRPQLMTAIRNDSKLTTARLTISTGVNGSNPIERVIDLPSAGQTRNYFVDLPSLGDVIHATLDVADDLPADNTAWLARQRTWPMVEPRAGLPAEVRRMTEVYFKYRPPSESSARVAVVEGVFNLPSNAPAVGVFTGTTKTPTSPARFNLRVVDHPVTAFVNWSAATRNSAAPATPGEGWQSLVSVGGQVFVAVREQPARQVWCALQSPDWPKSADFVVFWTNALDWAGEGAELFDSGNPDEVRPNWTKLQGPKGLEIGVYRQPDGLIRAVSAFDTRVEISPDPNAWRNRLAANASRRDSDPLELTRPITFLAALMVIAGVRTAPYLSRPTARI